MVRKPVTIRNSMDMEMRPIAHLVQEASQYKSRIFIEMEDKKINAKSIMGMMRQPILTRPFRQQCGSLKILCIYGIRWGLINYRMV